MFEQGIIQYLRAAQPVQAFFIGVQITTPRVFGVMLPAKDNKIPAIVFSRAAFHVTESLNGPNQLQTPRVQFDCYGRTHLESWQLAQAVENTWCPPDIDGNPTSLKTFLPDGSAVDSTRIISEIDKPFETGEGGYIFCASIDIEISVVRAA